MASIHQVNHPGKELVIKFKTRNGHLQDYYFFPESVTKGVRLWNGNKDHKRKFIEHDGKYLASISSTEQSGLLRFWGEYEGHSVFELLTSLPLPEAKYWNNPCAIHRPFFCNQKISIQNTDPFIFGENFYYAICKKARLKNICNGDIILFGSEFGSRGNVKFYLDTLFVVKDIQPSIIDPKIYDDIYQESTLKRIGISSENTGPLPIHVGNKFYKDSGGFSFFPARVADNNSFGRPIINTQELKLRKPGAYTGQMSRQLESTESSESIWQIIANAVIKQGFVLGTHCDPLPTLNRLP